MARRSRSRDLAGLAALGALGYMALRGGKQAPAPVEDRSMMPMPEADAPQGARIRGSQETPTRFDDDREPGGGGGAYDLQAIRTNQAAAAPVRAASTPARAAAPARLASPDADFPSGGRTMPLRQQLTQTTLGTPIAPDPDAPSIYAGPEAWAAYRQRQAARSAAQPPTQQGSARNIVQQMREKDKTVLAAVRRRQAEEEAVAQEAREAQAERLREARRVQPPSVNPAASRFQDIQARTQGFKKGGAVKVKKMASGGMTSASKRADGIATKGKTKCKMY